jgi:hypothetical protein
MKVRVSRSFITLSMLGLVGTLGCGTDGPSEPDANGIPVIDIALNRSFEDNRGLVTMLDNKGVPVRDPAAGAMDPTILEARTFYDTLASPNAPTATAPLTLDDWKRTFNIPARNEGESLEDYRKRADVIVYYNKNELGLGRELGCAEFDDGVEGVPGVACYVTNYGTAFRDVVNSLPLAEEGLHPKNTVCISYRPSAEPGYEVQFYTYNENGDRREYAGLDTLGPRPLPQVCMNCHGGSYDQGKHLAKYARFLPMDPNVVVFSESGPTSRAAQEEAIRKLNLLSLKSPLTPQQIVMIDKLYGGKVDVAGTPSANEWAPDAWYTDPAHRVLFDQVIKPNCVTCHAAMQSAPGGQELAIYKQFNSPALLDDALPAVLCNAFTMPNSQATMLNFWEPLDKPVTANGQTFNTGADMLLDSLGMSRGECANLVKVVNCNRGPDPDALCGNAYSGRACNRDTGKCVPDLKAPRQPGDPNGVCKTNGTRGCPFPEECRPATTPLPKGLEGFDGVCIP